MADEPPTSSKKDVLIDETKSDPPPQGPSNIIKVTTKEGKAIVVKREGDVQVQYEQELEKPDLREFKLRPIEKLKEASQRKYNVVGITMEAKYDEMTESEEEREVAKLTPAQKMSHQEMKDLMSIQGRLKGQIPGFAVGIQAYVTGRFPGVPSELAKPYVIEETGNKADLLTRMPPAQIDSLIQEHDQAIPRRDVVVQPGRRGITLSIDPNSDDEIYEINDINDSLTDVIKLTHTKEASVTQARQMVEAQKEKDTQLKKDDQVLIPDVISEQMAEEYIKEEGLDDNEPSDAETISSTSTADFDREEAKDLLDKISSCQMALSQHYNQLNQIVPHMMNAQLANYMGKIHIMPLMKAESGPVTKTYTEETTAEEFKFVMQGETHEEKLNSLVRNVPAKRIMLAIALGDVLLNRLSHSQASMKYGFSKTMIQRTLSGKTEHKKGGKQYQQERKCRAEQDASEPVKKRKNNQNKDEEEEVRPVQVLFKLTKEQDILPDLVEDDDDNQFSEVNIDA